VGQNENDHWTGNCKLELLTRARTIRDFSLTLSRCLRRSDEKRKAKWRTERTKFKEGQRGGSGSDLRELNRGLPRSYQGLGHREWPADPSLESLEIGFKEERSGGGEEGC